MILALIIVIFQIWRVYLFLPILMNNPAMMSIVLQDILSFLDFQTNMHTIQSKYLSFFHFNADTDALFERFLAFQESNETKPLVILNVRNTSGLANILQAFRGFAAYSMILDFKLRGMCGLWLSYSQK